MTYSTKAKYFMGASASETMTLTELLELANDDELKLWHELPLGYSNSQGDISLREKIAEDYPGLTAENIITFSGAQEAIFATYHALLKPQDQVQVVLPIFEPLALIAESIGADVKSVSLTGSKKQSWKLNVNELLSAIHASTILTAINFPHNPTGAMIKIDELNQIVGQCANNDSWLFSDEVFRGLEYQKIDQLPPVATMYEKGISLGVMSKAYGLGGVRVGWIACQNKKLIQRLLEIKHFLSICNGRADELLALIALNHADDLLSHNRETIKKNLKLLNNTDSLNSIVNWHQPLAGCVAYPEWLGGADASLFATELIQKKELMVIPGNCFLEANQCFRIGFGRKDFPEVFEHFLAN